MKKRRKIFQRAAALLCCILLLPSLVAVPASADSSSNNFMDLMHYIDAGVITVTSAKPSIELSLPKYSVVYYVDILFSCNGSFTSLSVSKDSQTRDLTIISLGSGIYRAYGNISGNGSSSLVLNFGVTSTIWVEFVYFDCALFRTDSFNDIGRLNVNYWNGSSDRYMDNPNSPLYCYLGYPGVIDNSFSWDYAAGVYIENWRKYDFIDVQLLIDSASVSSISCSIDRTFCPFEVSYIGDVELWQYHPFEQNGNIYDFAYGEESYLYVNLRVDLRGVVRTLDSDLGIMFSGQYSKDDSFICLYSVTGLISSETSELSLFWLKLKSLLSDLFGKNDPAAGEAQLTQEQIDYEVNMQIVGAMENWDSNISVVKTGYDDSLVRASPALIWLSTLADNVFNNMGWFGNIYLMLGLFSLFLFILSKSGLPHSIGRISRRD